MTITCRDIITLGLQLGRVVGVGRTPRASEAATGLEVLQGMYDAMVTGGMFGRLTDIFKSEDYTANEGERVTADNCTITIPDVYTDDGETRAPRDLACVSVVTDGSVTSVVHSGGQWEVMTFLALDDRAPLATRDKVGLAALLALYYVEAFGGELSPMWRTRAMRFQGSLSYKLGSTQPDREGVYY